MDTDVDAGGDTSWRGSGVGSSSVHHPTHCCICLTISDVGNCLPWCKKECKELGDSEIINQYQDCIKTKTVRLPQHHYTITLTLLYKTSVAGISPLLLIPPPPTPTMITFHPIDDSSPQQHPPNVNSIFDDGEDDALEVDGEETRGG